MSIKCRVDSFDEATLIMSVVWYVDEDTPTSRVGPVCMQIPLAPDNTPLVGDALTAHLGRRAPIGDLQRLVELRLNGAPNLAALKGELGVERDVTLTATPQIDLAQRPML